jgi:inhibitor of KinA sporulation pathway (predicted exonuclease)
MSSAIDLSAGKRYLLVDLEATCWDRGIDDARNIARVVSAIAGALGKG